MANKLVIFDLDNTLIITKPAAKNAYKQAVYFLAKRHGFYHERNKIYQQWKKIVQKLKGESDPVKRQLSYSLGVLMDRHRIPTTYVSQILAVFNKEFLSNLTLQRGVREIFTWLKNQKFQICVATESARSQAQDKLKAVGLLVDIDYLITSNEVARMKPDPRYYLMAMQSAQTSPGNTIVIGDKQKKDIEPAQSLGIRAILIPSNNVHLGTIKQQLTG